MDLSIEIKGGVLTDNLITRKALEIASKNGLSEIQGSRGWLEKFKTRHKLKARKIYGESFKENPNNHDDFLTELLGEIEKYGEENVYNADEIGFFYKLIPSRSICKRSKAGFKILKNRVSVLLCSNMTGTVKMKPLMVGKSAKPHCFTNFKVE